jgi:hypothetical protein
MRCAALLAVGYVILATATAAEESRVAQTAGTQVQAARSNYQPYQFLIGEWDSASGRGGQIHQSFRWGPGQSYIWYTTYVRPKPDAPEAVHFEGIMVWNAAHRALDYLFVIEPGSGGQEQGTIRAEADGTIVREVVLTQGNGRSGRFRQTFRQTGPNNAVTSLMRQTESGWEPNFPGSDNIFMTRRAT